MSVITIANKEYKSGMDLPALNKGKFMSSHLARWCAAQQNWHKIHYDQYFAKNHDKLPDIVINGALKQHFLWQFLYEAFDGKGWVWRIDYRFKGMDVAGEALEVRGKITDITPVEDKYCLEIDLEIFNVAKEAATTLATGVVVLKANGEPLVDMPDRSILPSRLFLSTEASPPEGDVPEHIESQLNQWTDPIQSDYPIDLSRLRLFADAVMGLRPVFYHPDSATYGVNGKTVAPPLFPIHGFELLPGTIQLSESEEEDGREGTYALSPVTSKRLGLSTYSVLNGGNSVDIYSLLTVGETVSAKSKLAKISRKEGRSGRFFVLEVINEYTEASSGRLLLIERQSSILR